MPFDPAKPAENSPLSSEEMREQLGALNDQHADTARNPLGLPELSFAIGDPPPQVEVQAIYDAYNALVVALRRV